MAGTQDWKIENTSGLPIIGTTHLVEGSPRGVVLLAHGFRGYKDYGFIPLLAQRLADERYLAHRFNFSHSGMGHGHGKFDEDEFRSDTWNAQVDDLLAVVGAVGSGAIQGGGQPLIMFGHSRGGVASLLAAGRHADSPELSGLKGIITAASPADACRLDDAARDSFLRNGYMDVPSSRTGQALRVDAAWLREQQADPEGHDVVTQAGRVRVPVAIIHGLDDSTVSSEDAIFLAEAVGDRAVMRLIDGGNHVFNMPNPADATTVCSPQFEQLQRHVVDLCHRWSR
ncbi:MAG: hypothetical protein CMJ40_00715 [Phycisphaerae bacterium]|nr:hypothetical protein [Phycisphaerae bacterium]